MRVKFWVVIYARNSTFPVIGSAVLCFSVQCVDTELPSLASSCRELRRINGRLSAVTDSREALQRRSDPQLRLVASLHIHELFCNSLLASQ